MGRKVFLSFLGVQNYTSSKYFIDGKEKIETRFVQIASLQFFCEDFKENDKILIFTTDTAKKQNWENYTWKNPYKKTKTDTIGLKENLNKLDLKTDFEAVWIPEETSEEQVWKMFDIVFKELENDDEIIFDITHGFRSSPMLLMTLINYAKFLKNITVRKIVYGAFEARNKNTNETKIWDLTNFALLQDWTSAADIFVNFGNAKRIKKLSVNKIADKMQDIMRLFSTVRGSEIINGFEFEKAKIEIKKFTKTISENKVFKPLLPLVDYMGETINKYERNNVKNGFIAIRFCINNDLIQQAFTLMQEMIVSYVLDAENEKHNKNLSRIVLSACFSTPQEKYSTRLSIYKKEKSEFIEKEKKLTTKFYKSKYVKLFKDVYNDLTAYRNDLNHAGTKGNAKVAEDFYNEAEILYHKIETIVQNIESEKI